MMIMATVISFLGLLIWLTIVIPYNAEQEEMAKGAYVSVYYGEAVEDLERAELIMCDSLFSFSHAEITDSISDLLHISNSHFPCFVQMKYVFGDGREKVIAVDSFDCGGCSGTNFYVLKNDSVKYIYHP